MRVISKKPLRQFWEKHRDAEDWLKAWLREVQVADWKSFADIRSRYGSADWIPKNKIIFNVKGNRYRLITKVNFKAQIVYIRFIGTPEEYDRLDVESL
ncbi:MAG: type II toxin-antitoxin system HigB family toxin [Leptospiraceae bacterium]|nr:type II toxin-antitoxin system HigB family toxin [Leptospiraceae bacterium]